MFRGINTPWQDILSEGYRDVRQVQHLFHFSKSELSALLKVQRTFPFFTNPYYLSLIDTDDPKDPIRMMSIPNLAEASAGGSFDTSGEKENTVLTGLQHKYPETALVLSTNQCAMYCRFCFRKRMIGLSKGETPGHITEIASYIRAHEEISSVLISGGDAFMNSNETIRFYLESLSGIPHLDLIRFGTRTPVVLPQRITSDLELLSILGKYCKEKRIYVVTQFNHPREVTKESAAAVDHLMALGIPVRNQTVLLRGINDDPEILGLLLKRLTAIGVQPYYVFQCRPVRGVKGRFQVPLPKGADIVQAAASRQNGLGKSFRYALSHEEGKIEILGRIDGRNMMFRYHQAKSPKNADRSSRGRSKRISAGSEFLSVKRAPLSAVFLPIAGPFLFFIAQCP